MAGHGRCRPDLAASSATRWCDARSGVRPGRFHLSAGTRRHFVRGDVRDFPVCKQLGLASPGDEELTPIEDDDTPFVEEEDRSSVSLGWVYRALMSAKARLGWLMSSAYRSLVSVRRSRGRLRSNARNRPSATTTDVIRAEGPGRIRGRRRGGRRGRGGSPAPRKKAAPRPPPEILRKIRTASFGLTGAEGLGPATAQQGRARSNSRALEGVLGDFGVRGEIVKANPGPVVTLYELEPAPGIKSSRVIGLADDIARSMSALSARVAVVAGRNAIGIELPNVHREKVYLRELLTAKDGHAQAPLVSARTSAANPSSSISRARRIC